MDSASQLAPGSDLVTTITSDADSVAALKEEFTTVNVCLAIFNRRGALADLQTWEVNLDDLDALFFMRTVTIPRNVEAGQVKVMMYSDQMTPLMLNGII